jgi:hypothetical protein
MRPAGTAHRFEVAPGVVLRPPAVGPLGGEPLGAHRFEPDGGDRHGRPDAPEAPAEVTPEIQHPEVESRRRFHRHPNGELRVPAHPAAVPFSRAWT